MSRSALELNLELKLERKLWFAQCWRRTLTLKQISVVLWNKTE